MIKFNQHNVVNTETKEKSRIYYSIDNHVSNRPVVTLYAKDYHGSLGEIFADEYVNDTDLMTDYFDKGRVRLFEDHPLYADARKAAEAKAAKDNARFDAKYVLSNL